MYCHHLRLCCFKKLGLFHPYANVTRIYYVLCLVPTVGTVPDMVKPTADCTKVLVAIEGELYDDSVNQTVVDRPGGIGVVTFETDPSGPLDYTLVDFTAFDSQ